MGKKSLGKQLFALGATSLFASQVFVAGSANASFAGYGPGEEQGSYSDAYQIRMVDKNGKRISYADLQAVIEYSYDNTNWVGTFDSFVQDEKFTRSFDTEVTSEDGSTTRSVYSYDFVNPTDGVSIRVSDNWGGGLLDLCWNATNKCEALEEGAIYHISEAGTNKGITIKLKSDLKTVEFGKAEILKINDKTPEEYLADEPVPENVKMGENIWYFGSSQETVTIKLTPAANFRVSRRALKGVSDLTPVEGQENVYTFVTTPFKYYLNDSTEHFERAQNVVNKTDVKDIESATIEGAENAVDSGSLRLSVSDLKLTDAQKKEYQKKAGDGELFLFFDLKLENIIYKDNLGADVWAKPLTNLNGKVKITLKLSEDIKTKSGEYFIIREHNGKYEEIPATYNSKANTLTFESDKFSGYAAGRRNASEIENAETGDNIALYISLGAVCLIGMVAAGFGIKKFSK